MKKGVRRKCLLGDLIVILYEEASKVSLQSFEQRVIVYAALKHILTERVRTKHPISLQA